MSSAAGDGSDLLGDVRIAAPGASGTGNGRQCLRFWRHGCHFGDDSTCFWRHPEGPHVVLQRAILREVPRTQLVEVAFTHAICFGRWLTREPLRPRAVHLEFAAPAYVEEHRRIFGCPVRFAQPRSEIVLDPALLQSPVVFADASARDTFVAHAEKLLGRLEGGRSAGERVLAVLSERIPGGMPDIDQTARRLHTSTRTLQRKLREERLSFTGLVDRARRSLVVEFLGNSRFSLGEISYLLGFADLSTFYRAFRRWMGTTPSAYWHSVAGGVARE